jgi:methyl-accepting chemotaxis protein
MNSGMTISRKFIVTSGIMIAAVVLQAAVSLYGFSNIHRGIESMTNESVPGIVSSIAMARDFFQLRGGYMHHILSQDVRETETVERENDRLLSGLRDDMHAFELSINSDEDRQTLAKVRLLVDQYADEWQSVLPISRQGKSEEAATLYSAKTAQTVKDLTEMLLELKERETAAQGRTATSVIATASHSFWCQLIIFLLSTLIGVIVVARMIREINSMLRQMVLELDESAEQIASASTQVSSSSQSLAQGSSEQAATIEETSTSALEINAMAQRNAENARVTTGMVTKSQDRFEQTNRSLAQMVDAMDGITNSSQRISKIIKVIDEIAFQTNILALNAAVEAARAGDAGMGFAVVADEVRNLAQRCAQAAKDTADLIEESIQKSNGGKARVDQVAEAIRLATSESTKMRLLVDEINHGSVEQACGIEQISRSISQMEQVTQSFAANAEQSAAAAEQLSAQAQTMKDAVERLTLMVDGNLKTERNRDHVRSNGGDRRASGFAMTEKLASPRQRAATHFKSTSSFDGAKSVTSPRVATEKAAANDFPMDEDFREF